MVLLDGARLAVTTLSVWPLKAGRVDRTTARRAMELAVVVGAALGGIVAAVAYGLTRAHFEPFPVAAIVVCLLALLTRGMHLDGLADTFDALASYRPPEDALAIMKSPEVGPLGMVAVVCVLLVDTAALTVLVERHHWTFVVGAVMAGRAAITMACSKPLPSARPDGLGAMVASTVHPAVAAVAFALACATAAHGFRPTVALTFVCAIGAVGLLLVQVRRRFGGITGDVLGAVCEIATAVTLVGLSSL